MEKISEKLIAPRSVQEERKLICNVCENKKYGVCMKCGCVIDLKVKLKNESCPIKKWQKHSSTNKKLAVVGKGSGGALSIIHFLKYTDWELEWYHDPNIPTQAVGEGSNILFPSHLWETLNFTHDDLNYLDGTVKTGIYKEGWGEEGKQFFHSFLPPNVGYHFSALKFQDYVINKFKGSKRVKIIEQNVSDYNDIDSDYVLNCAGKPKNQSDLITSRYIPVNSVYVTQCDWDFSQFQHTLTIAKKHGWVFGIPLKNRCSIGYLYNNNISTLEEIKEDVQEIFARFNLKPSDKTNAFSFGNYYRRLNFGPRVCHNGNASFFLEPLEATSFSTMIQLNHLIQNVWDKPEMETKIYAQDRYFSIILEIQAMIMMHYFAGSKYKSEFWDFAKERGQECMLYSIKHNAHFRKIINSTLQSNDPKLIVEPEFGTWGGYSFNTNIYGLGIKSNLESIIQNI